VEQWAKDLRRAARSLARDRSIAAIAVVALGLGIGLTTVMFSIVYGAIHRGLPFEGADRLMHLERADLSRGIDEMGVSIHDYVDWRARQRSFETLGAFYDGTVNIRWAERAERYEGAFLSSNALDIISTSPILGRGFTVEDTQPGQQPVVLLGYELWQERFDGDRSVLETTLSVNGEAARVVGVMPEGFEFPLGQEVWVPLRLDPNATGNAQLVYSTFLGGSAPDGADRCRDMSVDANGVVTGSPAARARRWRSSGSCDRGSTPTRRWSI